MPRNRILGIRKRFATMFSRWQKTVNEHLVFICNRDIQANNIVDKLLHLGVLMTLFVSVC